MNMKDEYIKDCMTKCPPPNGYIIMWVGEYAGNQNKCYINFEFDD